MTGLDPSRDTILSVACFVTDHSLNLLDPTGYEAIVSHEQSALSQMNEWCIEHHGASGLTRACLESKTNTREAAEGLLAYIKKWVPSAGKALLAGNSVHADKAFLSQGPWSEVNVLGWLHYRILDVSAIKEAVRRWAPSETIDKIPVKKNAHTAKEDILESIEEARFYKQLIEKACVS
ncbi:MAG: hypothetical protein Q9227_003544 [Pyrenula ochraceoflavens]